jgi:hypothetical protein
VHRVQYAVASVDKVDCSVIVRGRPSVDVSKNGGIEAVESFAMQVSQLM